MSQRICLLILNVLGIEIPCAFPDKECKFKKIDWNGINIYTCDNVNDEIVTIFYIAKDEEGGVQWKKSLEGICGIKLKNRTIRREVKRMSRKEKRKHVKEHIHITHSDAKCIFCGSTDVTVHHVVFRRFAPELENDPNNQVPMCARCQRIYHQITDILLNYLKINSHQIDNHEIRLPKPILPPPKEEVKEIPQINISGGEVTINF